MKYCRRSDTKGQQAPTTGRASVMRHASRSAPLQTALNTVKLSSGTKIQ
jgi:hypothetical protein